jgi:hypothetical protein
MIYGEGLLKVGGKVVHDFIDGPLDTDNPDFVKEAKKQGFSLEAPEPAKKAGKKAG